MCGRYASFLPAETLRALLDTVNPTPNWEPTWNGADARCAGGAAASADMRAASRPAALGAGAELAKDPKSVRQPINARAETLAGSAMFRDAPILCVTCRRHAFRQDNASQCVRLVEPRGVEPLTS